MSTDCDCLFKPGDLVRWTGTYKFGSPYDAQVKGEPWRVVRVESHSGGWIIRHPSYNGLWQEDTMLAEGPW